MKPINVLEVHLALYPTLFACRIFFLQTRKTAGMAGNNTTRYRYKEIVLRTRCAR